MKKDIASKATLEVGEDREYFIIKGEINYKETEKFRFTAEYKKNLEDKKEKWKKIDKILELNKKEQFLACDDILEFMKQQGKKGNMPEGFYSGVRLYGLPGEIENKGFKVSRKPPKSRRKK